MKCHKIIWHNYYPLAEKASNSALVDTTEEIEKEFINSHLNIFMVNWNCTINNALKIF